MLVLRASCCLIDDSLICLVFDQWSLRPCGAQCCPCCSGWVLPSCCWCSFPTTATHRKDTGRTTNMAARTQKKSSAPGNASCSLCSGLELSVRSAASPSSSSSSSSYRENWSEQVSYEMLLHWLTTRRRQLMCARETRWRREKEAGRKVKDVMSKRTNEQGRKKGGERRREWRKAKGMRM